MPTLDGTKTLRVKPGTTHGTVQRLRGEGPPKLNSGSPPAKGDIHYRFVIDVPEDSSEEQQDAVDALSKAINGDPRAGLFADGAGPPRRRRRPARRTTPSERGRAMARRTQRPRPAGAAPRRRRSRASRSRPTAACS